MTENFGSITDKNLPSLRHIRNEVFKELEKMRDNGVIYMYLKYCQSKLKKFTHIKKRKSDAVFYEIVNSIDTRDEEALIAVLNSIKDFKKEFISFEKGDIRDKEFFVPGFETQSKEFVRQVFIPLLNKELKENYMLSNVVLLYGSSGSGKTYFVDNVVSHLRGINMSCYHSESLNVRTLSRLHESYHIAIFDNAETMMEEDDDYEYSISNFGYSEEAISSSTVYTLSKKNTFFLFVVKEEKMFNYLMNRFDLNTYIDFDVFTDGDVRDMCRKFFHKFEIKDKELLFDYISDFVHSRKLSRRDLVKLIKSYLNDMYYRGDISNQIDIKEFLDYMYASSF